MSGILLVKKISFLDHKQQICTALVKDIQIIQGKIHFVCGKKYQHLKLTTDNCKIKLKV